MPIPSVPDSHDRERDGLNRELRASSSPVIDDFILELETRQHEVRHSSPEVHEVVDAPAGVRRWFSRSPAITRTLDGITAARGAAEDLRLDAVENIDQAIADVRDAIPAVGLAEIIQEEKLATW